MTERAGPMQSDAFDTSPLVNRASVVYGVSVLAWIPLRHFQWACVGIAIADYLFLITQCLDRLESGSACGAFTYLNGRTRVLVTSGLMCYSPSRQCSDFAGSAQRAIDSRSHDRPDPAITSESSALPGLSACFLGRASPIRHSALVL